MNLNTHPEVSSCDASSSHQVAVDGRFQVIRVVAETAGLNLAYKVTHFIPKPAFSYDFWYNKQFSLKLHA